MTKGRKTLLRLCISACLLALALVLPFATGQIPAIGKMLCPMHLPVLICGFVCGPVYAGVIGAIAPILRSVLFTVPKIFPDAPGMCVELMFYGIVSGLLYKFLPKKKPFIYLSLVSAMLVGRVAWGITRLIFLGVWGSPFGWAAFFSGAFAKAFPGIIVQIIFVPILVMTIEREFPNLVTRGGTKLRGQYAKIKKSRRK